MKTGHYNLPRDDKCNQSISLLAVFIQTVSAYKGKFWTMNAKGITKMVTLCMSNNNEAPYDWLSVILI